MKKGPEEGQGIRAEYDEEGEQNVPGSSICGRPSLALLIIKRSIDAHYNTAY